MNIYGHFKTITSHKALVMKYCFRVGLYKQGILHDLSKYTPTEFIPGARYFQGNRSPNNAEREETGLSKAWLHHKGRNKHHFEYWIDYGVKSAGLQGMEMPTKYVVEMCMDRIAASKTYLKEAYQDSDPLSYYQKSAPYIVIHEKARKQLERMLIMLAERGEEETFRYIRQVVLRRGRA